ncbi:MAG TPA: hypothetical protein VFS43_14650 [Polyangiaceae bacterium]|nr:hypothetical protein [Polyangiaceae bacterium]
MDSITYILGKGAPGLLNLRLPVYRAHILVNGPVMLYGRMRLLTSLGLHDGSTFARLSALASALRVVALCGHTGAHEVPVELVSTRIGVRVEFGVGPAGMYQSELVLSTADDRPFDEVLQRIFGERAATAFFALEPLPGEGHHGGTAHGEGHHGGTAHGGTAHGEGHHGGPTGGHHHHHGAGRG